MKISSTQNPLIKDLKKQVKQKELAVLDNPKLIEEAVKSNIGIEYIIKKEGYLGKTDYGGNLLEVADCVFNLFSTTEHSQGLLALIKFNTKVLKPPQNNFLVLDNVQDPGNVGTLIRSALGANFLDVYLLNCASVSSDKVLRSTMGAIFKTNIYECDKYEFIKNFKQWSLPLYTCDMDGENIYKKYFEKGIIGIVIGNEGQGVCEEIINVCTGKICIPMQNGLESLNAGVSGSIIMYHISNQT